MYDQSQERLPPDFVILAVKHNYIRHSLGHMCVCIKLDLQFQQISGGYLKINMGSKGLLEGKGGRRSVEIICIAV